MFTSTNRKSDSSKTGAPPTGEHAPPEPAATEPNPLWQSLATRAQAKLKVSAPDDPAEQEADRVAEQVMRSPETSPAQTAVPAGIQAKAATPGNPMAFAAPPQVEKALHSTGQPLEPVARGLMESRLGQDFSGVRVHADGEAAQSADALEARAYTIGGDIVFGSDEYAPTTSEGRRLLAHELTHVVQQQSAPGDALQRDKAPAPATEKPDGSLWAKDAEGKPLPPSLEDISQGGVADCFLFAAMAAVVNTNPQRIVKMIRENSDGTYTVTFEGIGVFSSASQTVSADFVVGKHGNVTGRKALWPLVIEKAYAQQKGGIDVLNKGGNPGTAVDDIINEGASRFDPRGKTADYIMGKLAKAKTEKWPVTVLSPKKDGASKEKKELADKTSNLYFWHSYAVIDLDSAKNRIKLFNPWGSDHPNGDGWLDVSVVRDFFIEISIND